MFSNTRSQDLKLKYQEHQVIPETIDQINKIGGLSGITYNPETGIYLACADKFPARLVQLILTNDGQFIPDNIIMLTPGIIAGSELEGIAFDPISKGFYLSDEQADGTRIIQVDSLGRFVKIVLPKNAPFLPLSNHNSGIEGLSLSGDGGNLYFAYERPTRSCFKRSITTIGKIDLRTNKTNLYAYQLHEVADDNLQTNGISEILWLAENSLLVMERAYLPGTGNIVRLYETELPEADESTENPLRCQDLTLKLLKSTLVFDFASVPEMQIDNAEGMTFSANRSQLIIVTDNNFSDKQKTQVIKLEANW